MTYRIKIKYKKLLGTKKHLKIILETQNGKNLAAILYAIVAPYNKVLELDYETIKFYGINHLHLEEVICDIIEHYIPVMQLNDQVMTFLTK